MSFLTTSRFPALAAVAALMLAAPVAAQDDACSQSDPCVWALDVDETGFQSSEESLNATINDWYVFNVFNLDDVEHSISLEGYDVSFMVAPLEEATSAPIQLTQAGLFSLDDEPSADFIFVQVFETDVIDEEADAAAGPGPDGESHEDKVQPLPLTVAMGALLLVAALIRRK